MPRIEVADGARDIRLIGSGGTVLHDDRDVLDVCLPDWGGEGLRNKRIHDDGRRTLGQELLHPGNLTLRVQAAVLDDEGAAVAGGDGSHALELFREARDCVHRRHVADLAPFARCPGRVRLFRGEVRAIWRDVPRR